MTTYDPCAKLKEEIDTLRARNTELQRVNLELNATAILLYIEKLSLAPRLRMPDLAFDIGPKRDHEYAENVHRARERDERDRG